MKKNVLPKLIAIVGPTASGKTDLAIALAKKFRGEIISADSRQFYRGMEIGSDIIFGSWQKRGGEKTYIAKGIPHHLIAFRSPDEPISAAEFQSLVIKKADEIIARKKIPFLVGGTGLFIRVVIDNFVIPKVPPNPLYRQQLEKRTTTALFKILQKKDIVYSKKISSENRRYIIRALEVIKETGKPFSELQISAPPRFTILQIGIKKPRTELYSRIEARVDMQMKRGLLREARKLGRLYGWDIPSMSGLGHRQLGLFLEGKISFEEAISLIKRDTRHFAKRQMTWFGRDRRIRWVSTSSQAEKMVKTFLTRKK